MNALDTAASIVEKAWCRSEMVSDDGDKFCAAGALIAALGYKFKWNPPSEDGSGYYSEHTVVKDGKEFRTYEVLENTPEGKHFADAIVEFGFPRYGKHTETIFEWNDNEAKDHDDVARMMRKGARTLDQTQA